MGVTRLTLIIFLHKKGNGVNVTHTYSDTLFPFLMGFVTINNSSTSYLSVLLCRVFKTSIISNTTSNKVVGRVT